MRNLFGNSITPEQRDKSEGKERNDDTNKDRGAKVIATRGRYFERRIKIRARPGGRYALAF